MFVDTQEEPGGDAGDMVVSFPDDYPNSVSAPPTKRRPMAPIRPCTTATLLTCVSACTQQVRHFLLIGFMGMLLGAGIFFYQGYVSPGSLPPSCPRTPGR